MKIAGSFITAALLWALGMSVVMIGVDAMSSEPASLYRVLRAVASALGLATFPAGVAVATALLAQSQRWRPLLHVIAAAVAISVIVVALSIAAPPIGDGTRGLAERLRAMNDTAESWETRNDAAWAFLATLLTGPRALLFAAIGLQVGIWANFSVPRTLRRPLYWAVGLGLILSGAVIWITTYETIVLHTEADASFAALYTLLLPLSVCAGLGLPTLAVLRDVSPFRT
jgi:MFS family permease